MNETCSTHKVDKTAAYKIVVGKLQKRDNVKDLVVNGSIILKEKRKGVPLHAMEALGGRGGIAPTHT
jgi:hypothetical protein